MYMQTCCHCCQAVRLTWHQEVQERALLTCIRAYSCCCLVASELAPAAVNAGTAEAGRKARSMRSVLAEPSWRLSRWQLCCASLAAGVSFPGSTAAAACSRSQGAVLHRRSCALLACSPLSEVPPSAPAKACTHIYAVSKH